MKRIEIHYQGRVYSVANETMESVRERVNHALRGADSHWLHVQNGEGLGQDASLLITPGIPIAIVNPVPTGSSNLVPSMPDEGAMITDLL